MPDKSEFPDRHARSKSQGEWLDIVKTGGCSPATRSARQARGQSRKRSASSRTRRRPGRGASSRAGAGHSWRATSAASAPSARSSCSADWTDRIAAGELPFAKPERPQGIERNVVDHRCGTGAIRTPICTTRSRPTGAIRPSTPTARSTARRRTAPTICRSSTRCEHRERGARCRCAIRTRRQRKDDPHGAVALLGTEADLGQPDHHAQSDDGREGPRLVHRRASAPTTIRLSARQGSDHPSAKVFPLKKSNRHLAMYDPTTGKFTLIRHVLPHPPSALRARRQPHAVDFSAGGGGPACVGWLNRKMFEETGDEAKSQGWTPFILDTNGNGKRDDYVEPNQPVDPTKDKRIAVNIYAVAVSPADGSVWGSVLGYPGLRSCASNPGPIRQRRRSRKSTRAAAAGLWPARRRHRPQRRRLGAARERPSRQLRPPQVQGPLNGPTATGKHCPEGWTLYQLPGPAVAGRARTPAAPRRATTPGSTGSTRSAWARTCRSPWAT